MSHPSYLRRLYRHFKHRDFLSSRTRKGSRQQKSEFIDTIHQISFELESPHTQYEILAFAEAILNTDDCDGVVVEAGCFKGSSTAKFSIAAEIAEKSLVVFDSFLGLPDSDENHSKNIFGGPANFYEGAYQGSRAEVEANVRKHGRITQCEFVEGWFEDTMPHFTTPILAAYIDVDLVSSTRTCVKHLYPLLVPGARLYSQDGHLPLIIELLEDESFWREELGIKPPTINGLGSEKLVWFSKPRD